MTKAASQVTGVISMLSDFGINVNGKVLSDSTAAIGIAYRAGLGKTRHIRVQYLWIQQEVDEGRICLEKVLGTDNPADLMTKSLKKEDMTKIMNKLGIEVRHGRSEHSLKLQQMTSSDFLLKGTAALRRRYFSMNGGLQVISDVSYIPKVIAEGG